MKLIFCSLFVFVVLIFGTFKVGAQSDAAVKNNVSEIHNVWLDKALQLTKNCVGFSAPVSSRAFMYLTIGMYESSVEIMDSLVSLNGQLKDYQRTVWNENRTALNWEIVVNSADFTLISYLYRNMPPKNRKEIVALNDSIVSAQSKFDSRSINYGIQIAEEIINWSKGDGGDKGFENNFPDDFNPPVCDSCWVKTTPNYLSALLPTWGENKNLIAGSDAVVADCQVLPFSTDSSSLLYKDADGILELSKSLSPEYEIIAEYWNDAPGYTGTPSGHFFSLARNLTGAHKLSPEETLICYVKLGIALNESNIHAWRLKYKYSFIRPITYIHRYIDGQFNSFIPTPPFPEFPSGHSFQSGSGTEIFASIFGASIQIVDNTHVNRTDIDGTPRVFNSFSEMGEEISISRYYGGIHFLETLNISLDYGRRLGRYVNQSIQCRP